MKAKNILLVILLFVFGLNSYSQIDSTYVPFPTDSVAWKESGNYLINIDPYETETYSNFIFLIGDTIIDSLTYSKVYVGREIFDTQDSHTFIKGGLREENKKIYFKDFSTPSLPEKLYYDFTLNIGDSIYWDGYFCCRLEFIDSLQMVDGSFRKRYNYSGGFPMQIVEGIGSTYVPAGGLLHPNSTFFFENSNMISCVVKPDEEIYIYNYDTANDYNCYSLYSAPGPIDSCCISINELEENNQLIYPNPFENVLNFAEKLDKSKVVVYSISGKKVFENNNFSGNTLDLHFLEKGIYYLKVKAEKSYYQKIVKL